MTEFQFTPLREGRLTGGFITDDDGTFQFTPLREGRRDVHGYGYRQEPISIHAPPRGATGCRRSGIIVYTTFQFTPLREGRPNSVGGIAYYVIFQFTPLREGRRGTVSKTYVDEQFQFTPLREGRRARKMACIRPLLISIHAPPRGATRPHCECERIKFNFNSRPSARGDGVSASRPSVS